uniref:Potassium voltage-gated channel subfamily E regulatory subunit 5 n=1 Tax=Aquila chrysaetos chrysaetos TaxID=223781 RepID=A0A663EW56_AQUCH
MNCSEPRRLQALLGALLRELRGGGGNASAAGSGFESGSRSGSGPGGDASLYILLIMIFYGCLAGGLILAYTRSRKLESKHDPYHLYIEPKVFPRGKPGAPATAAPGLCPRTRTAEAVGNVLPHAETRGSTAVFVQVKPED